MHLGEGGGEVGLVSLARRARHDHRDLVPAQRRIRFGEPPDLGGDDLGLAPHRRAGEDAHAVVGGIERRGRRLSLRLAGEDVALQEREQRGLALGRIDEARLEVAV